MMLSASFLFLFSQSDQEADSIETKEECTSALMYSDQMPLFDGCDESLSEKDRKKCTEEKMKMFFNEHFEIPSAVNREKATGTTIANFLVEKDGSLSNIRIEGETGYGMEEETRRVLMEIPKFLPGKNEGKAECIFMRFEIPVKSFAPLFKISTFPPYNVSTKSNQAFYKVVDKMPLFKHASCDDKLDFKEKKACADKNMLEAVYKNVTYPAEARANKIQGTVVIQFIVTKKGTIKDAKIVRDIGHGCGEEALRVIALLNDWEPGYQGDEPVDVQFNLPVKFRLD